MRNRNGAPSCASALGGIQRGREGREDSFSTQRCTVVGSEPRSSSQRIDRLDHGSKELLFDAAEMDLYDRHAAHRRPRPRPPMRTPPSRARPHRAERPQSSPATWAAQRSRSRPRRSHRAAMAFAASPDSPRKRAQMGPAQRRQDGRTARAAAPRRARDRAARQAQRRATSWLLRRGALARRGAAVEGGRYRGSMKTGCAPMRHRMAATARQPPRLSDRKSRAWRGQSANSRTGAK